MLLVAVRMSGLAFGQAFEVASVKVSAPGAQPANDFSPSGRIAMSAVTMKQLVLFAWGLDPEMLLGTTSWMASDHFDLVAKAPAGTNLETMRLMMRTLLAERFKLAVHSDERTVPVYALVPGRHDPRLKAAAGSEEAECRMKAVDGVRTYVCTNMTMAGLADRLRDAAPRIWTIRLWILLGSRERSTLVWLGLGGERSGLWTPSRWMD
jgi:uncharacterized protein (TIGR03435 family)